MRELNIAFVRVLFVILASLTGSVGRVYAAADPASSTYQIDPAHDGAISFSKPFAPPLKMRWSVNLGAPVSYPVVAGNLAIVLANAKNLPMTALNITTGKTAWRKAVLGGYFPGSYLAYDNGTVFVATAFEPLQAFKAPSGAFLWVSKQFQSFSDFVPVAAYGYVYGGGDGTGTTLYRLDEKTGAESWVRSQGEGGGSGGTLGGGTLYFPVQCYIPAYTSFSGKQIWGTSPGCGSGVGGIAAYHDGRLYGPNLEAGIVLDSKSGKLLSGMGGYPTPALYKQVMYTIAGVSLVASDIGTGNVKWFFQPQDPIEIPPIVINGNVYSLSSKGTLYVNDGRTGTLLQSLKVCATASSSESSHYVGLGAGENTLLVPCGNSLVAFRP